MAWGFVQSNTNNAIGASSLTVTYNSNVQSGNKLISQIIIAPGVLSTITSVQDAALNSETNCGEASGGTGGNTDGAIYAMDVPAGDAGTRPQIKVTYGQTADMRMIVEEFSGLAAGNTTAAMIDGTAAAVEETPVSPQAQPAYTSTALNELLFTFLGDNGNSVSWTLPTGYTADGSNTNGDPNNDLLVAWKNSTNGAESGSWVTSGTPTGSVLIVVAFKLAAAGGPVALPPQPGAPSWRQRFRLPQAPFPPNPPPLAPPQSPQLPQPGAPSWRQRFRLAQTPQWQPNAPPSAPTPVPFTPPRYPAKGPPAATAGRLTRAAGQQGHPSPFTAPHSPARGQAAARKGTLTGAFTSAPLPQPPPLPQPGARSWRQRFRLPQVPQGPNPPPPAAGPPSVFTLPPIARGTPAARKGTLASSAGETGKPGPPAPFFPPHSPAKGAQAARKGTLAAIAGRLGIPAPFQLPRALARGRSAAGPGKITRGTGQPGAPAPFTQPRSPLRPAPPAARPGRLTRARGAAGTPAPFTAPHSPARGQAAARKGTLAFTAAPPPVVQPSVPAPFFPPHTLLRGQVPVMARTRTAFTAAPPPVTAPPAQPPHWQGSTHMIAASAAGNLILGAPHTGTGGPGDLKGDYERSGD